MITPLGFAPSKSRPRSLAKCELAGRCEHPEEMIRRSSVVESTAAEAHDRFPGHQPQRTSKVRCRAFGPGFNFFPTGLPPCRLVAFPVAWCSGSRIDRCIRTQDNELTQHFGQTFMSR